MSYVNKVSVGGNTHLIEPTLYGVCSTQGSTAAKTVDIDSSFVLQQGVQITVKFTNANTASNPTLSVNGSTAKAIYYNGSTATNVLVAGKIFNLIYDGTYWQVIQIPTASDTVIGGVTINSTLSPLTVWTNPLTNLPVLTLNFANSATIKAGDSATQPFAVKRQHEAVFYGLAKAAGDTSQSSSTNSVGVYTTSAQAAIQEMLNVPSTSDVDACRIEIVDMWEGT